MDQILDKNKSGPFIKSDMSSFPDSTHDDYVDSTTQAIRLLKDMGFLQIDPEPRYDDDDYADVKPKRTNPYSA